MKIYNDIITIKQGGIDKLKKILGVNSIIKKEVRLNILNKSIKSIYIASKVRGKYRLRSFKRIYYDSSFSSELPSVALFKENSINIILDLKKVYYDSTYANERKKLLNQLNQVFKVPQSIDILYGGIGIFGFYLAEITKIDRINIIDFNPACEEWFFKSLLFQPKRIQEKLFFLKEAVLSSSIIKRAKTAICIAPLSTLPLKKLLLLYEEIYYYKNIPNINYPLYILAIENIAKVCLIRKVKEYSKDSSIYLIHIRQKDIYFLLAKHLKR